MKTSLRIALWVAVLSVVAGCGGDKTRTVKNDASVQKFEIRLLGEKPANLTAALVGLSGLDASARGAPLEVEPAADRVDLTVPNQAWLIGKVAVPEGVTEVDFSLRFDDAGGYESAAGNGALEARGAEVRWRAPVEWLQTHGHVVVHVDLSRSLVYRGVDTARLLPNASIHY